MNDFEHKLTQQPFREPPADLRRAILGATSGGAVPPVGTWRDWLWPSPLAWAALAMVWVCLYAIEAPQRKTRDERITSHRTAREPNPQALALLVSEREHLLAEVLKYSPAPAP